MRELVHHPLHYNEHPSGIECIEVIEHMGFCLGNAVKYIWRADLKENAIQDLEKAIFYINREIDRRKDEARSEEESPREPDFNEHIKSDWAIGTAEQDVQAYNQEGSVSDSEHKLQHDKAWEDYLRAQRTLEVYCET